MPLTPPTRPRRSYAGQTAHEVGAQLQSSPSSPHSRLILALSIVYRLKDRAGLEDSQGNLQLFAFPHCVRESSRNMQEKHSSTSSKLELFHESAVDPEELAGM